MAVRARPVALRPLACVASLHFTSQGLIGLVLAVLALNVCFCALGDSPTTQNYTLANYLTYYLQGEECEGNDFVLYSGVTSPTAMRVWMCLSLFFSVSMTVSSIVLFVAVVKRWADEKLQITVISWILINTLAAIDDLILGYVFTNDLVTVLDNTSTSDTVGPLAVGIVAFLSLRGVYVWFMNIAFLLYLACAARALHKYLNVKVPLIRDDDTGSWPTLDDFGTVKDKGVADIERSFTAVNQRLTQGLENGGPEVPQHSALARWPTLNGQPYQVDGERERARHRGSKTMRESSLYRQNGVDNPGYQTEPHIKPIRLRLQSETGSSKDYEEVNSSAKAQRDYENHRTLQHWELPRGQDRRREISDDSPFGQYNRRTPDPRVPQGGAGYIEENGVPIPPVDYLDPTPQELSNQDMSYKRTQSLQEAILDRTLRLKKVPEELKRGINYN